MNTDAYGHIDYRSLVDWPQRLEREWPLLGRVLQTAPARSVLDLGSGGGEHARYFASKGFEVTGVDVSRPLVDEARRLGTQATSFVQGDIADVGGLLAGRQFGAAVCLGNTLPHMCDGATLDRLLSGVRDRLLPGGVLVLQLLNYERIFSQRLRAMPPLFRRQAGGEVVFLRLMDLREDGTVIFCPTLLRFEPAQKSPVAVQASERVVVRGWRRPELIDALGRAGFGGLTFQGQLAEVPYDAATSTDLVVVATRGEG